jgi:undecaprenyl-diphosphatase
MDEAILRAVNSAAQIAWIADLGRFLSSPWCAVLVLLPTGIVLARCKRFWAMGAITLAMISADRINTSIVKPLCARERPCRALTGLEEPVHCGPGQSFASGHATIAFAFLLSAAPVVRYGWAIFSPIAALISGSRVLLGVHYPSDVLGGAVLGALVGASFTFGRKKLEARGAQKDQSSSAP